MKTIPFTLLVKLALMLIAHGAPVGLCLHAYGPDAPADKIECFEYEKLERVANDYRFFVAVDRAALVTGYRFRDTIPYKPELTPGNPEFGKLLKLYEETASATPSTRRYLNSRILAMRELSSKHAEERLFNDGLSKVILDNQEYASPKFKVVEDGKLVINHKDGVAKIDLDKVTNEQLQALVRIDPGAAGLKAVEICKTRLWNPSMASITSDSVKIRHEKGMLTVKFSSLNEKDRATIDGWSDGTWKAAAPGFYGSGAGNRPYSELVVENGRFYHGVKLHRLDGENVAVSTREGGIKFPFASLVKLPGMAGSDKEQMSLWGGEILEARLKDAKPFPSTEIIGTTKSEEAKVTEVRARILQVLDQGVLASEFVGNLHKGTQTVRTTRSVAAMDPLTDKAVGRVVDTKTEEVEVIEEVSDDLCYIVGDTSKLTEGEIVRISSMKLMGRHQYLDVLNRPRTVREYHVNPPPLNELPAGRSSK